MENHFVEYNLVDNIAEFETITLSIEKSSSAYEFLSEGKEEMIHQSQLFSRLSKKIVDFLINCVETYSFIDTRNKYEELENNISGKYMITNQLILSELTSSKYYTKDLNIYLSRTNNVDFMGLFKNTECYIDLYSHFTNTTCYCFNDKVVCDYNINKMEDLNNVTYNLNYKLKFDGVVESIFFVRDESDKRWMVPLRDDKFKDLFN